MSLAALEGGFGVRLFVRLIMPSAWLTCRLEQPGAAAALFSEICKRGAWAPADVLTANILLDALCTDAAAAFSWWGTTVHEAVSLLGAVAALVTPLGLGSSRSVQSTDSSSCLSSRACASQQCPAVRPNKHRPVPPTACGTCNAI